VPSRFDQRILRLLCPTMVRPPGLPTPTLPDTVNGPRERHPSCRAWGNPATECQTRMHCEMRSSSMAPELAARPDCHCSRRTRHGGDRLVAAELAG